MNLSPSENLDSPEGSMSEAALDAWSLDSFGRGPARAVALGCANRHLGSDQAGVPSRDLNLSLGGDSETESHQSNDINRFLDRLFHDLARRTAAVLHGALGAHAPTGLVHDDP